MREREFPSKGLKLFLALFILLIYVTLPLLILAGIIPFDLKFYALTIGAVVVYIVLRICGFSNENVGIKKTGWFESIKHVSIISLILALVGILLWALGLSRITPNETWGFFVFYIFISSPVQEFLYRGALNGILEAIGAKEPVQMIITSLLYSFVHIIYKDILTLLLTFAIGLIWFLCYRKTKNLVGVSISHAILGVVTIVGGFIN